VGYCANYYVYISYGTSRDKVGGGGRVGVATARLGGFDCTTFYCILITSRGQRAFDIILPIIL
jgi:hypothetical protein